MNNQVDLNGVLIVDIKEITLITNIGCGSYSDVYSAKWPNKYGHQTIAVKKLRHSPDSDQSLKRELNSLSRLKHPNIVKLFGISNDHENKMHILLEYAEYGSLYNFLHIKKYEKSTISDAGKLFWMIQCATGIAYLHKNERIHRDLKTQNILLFDNFKTLKLCDFGTVREIASNNTANTGTANYMAPEVATGRKYDAKCDVYSFGIIFWEVMSRKKPFYHLGAIPGLAIQYKVIEGDRPPVSDIQSFENSQRMIELMEQCWDDDLKKRPTMQQVIQILKSSYGHIALDRNYPIVQISEAIEDRGIIYKPSMIDKVEWKDIELEMVIGPGYFAEVYRAKWNNKDIAVKCFRATDQEFKHMLLPPPKHKNIVEIYGISKDFYKRPVLLMELADCGSLYNVIHGNDRSMNYSYFHALKWMHQCVQAMAYMHKQNLIHRNLNSRQLLLAYDFQTLKICYSNCLTEVTILMIGETGTAEYMAPEVVNGEHYTEKCDVYSFGIVLWEVMSRKKPYSNIGHPLAIMNAVTKGTRPDLNDANIFMSVTPIKELIARCWHSDPQERPTMEDLVLSLGEILLSI